MSSYVPSQLDSPFQRLGGESAARALAEAFYAHMDAHEPALARLHQLDADGRVAAKVRERFSLFLVEWLGGPRAYSSEHGHPRLRMRHAHVPVSAEMGEAWLRCMGAALATVQADPDVLDFLTKRFREVAQFLRNVGD